MFILEGVPAVLLGLVTLGFLDDKPAQAKWLSEEERRALASELAFEAEATREAGYSKISDALTRPRVLVLGLLYFCLVIGLYGIGFWMPQVIQTFGHTPLQIGFLTAVPYLFAAVAMVLWGRRSDRTGERTWHVALPLFLAGAAFAWSSVSGPLVPTMIALTLAAIGIYCAIGTFWSFPTAILTGAGAAAGIALVNSMGNAGGLVGPALIGVMKEQTGDFTQALLFLAGSLALAGIIALLFGYGTGPGAVSSPRARAQDLP